MPLNMTGVPAFAVLWNKDRALATLVKRREGVNDMPCKVRFATYAFLSFPLTDAFCLHLTAILSQLDHALTISKLMFVQAVHDLAALPTTSCNCERSAAYGVGHPGYVNSSFQY